MIISVASGKGGTGKTLFSVNLFLKLRENYDNISLLDLDVEEPNCYYMLNSEYSEEKKIYTDMPIIDNDKCISCGVCSSVCNFNAVIVLPDRRIISESLCHSCGRCKFNCMSGAIKDMKYEIGTLNYITGSNAELMPIFASGTLKEGSVQSKELIAKVKKFIKSEYSNENNIIIQDCPPGVSCNMTEAVKNSDIVILITEPTPFGLHDLQLAVETVKKMNMKFYVIINKSDENDFIIEDFCEKENIKVLAKIPYAEEICSLYAEGKPSISVNWYENIIISICDKINLTKNGVKYG